MEHSSSDQKHHPPAAAAAATNKAAVLWEQLQELQKNEAEDLTAEREQLEKEKETMNKLNADMSDIVEINVGGQVVIQTHRSTLCLAPNSMFSHLFSGRWDNASNCVLSRDEKGRIFLDHDPLLIQSIVNYLRLKKIEQQLADDDVSSSLSSSSPSMPLPKVPEGKKEEFDFLLHHFGLTSFFYPNGKENPNSNSESGSDEAGKSINDNNSTSAVVDSYIIDFSKIEVVQPGGGLLIEIDRKTNKDKEKNNSILSLTYNGDKTTYFVACTPSLFSPCQKQHSCSWKVTLDTLPTDAYLFMGVIGNLQADGESYYDPETYGWATDGRYVGGTWCEEEGPPLLYIAEAESYYFHLIRHGSRSKLTMLNTNVEQVVSMNFDSMDEVYIHFNFYDQSTKISLEALSDSEYDYMLEMIP